MLKRVRILVIGLALIGAITLVTGKICSAASVMPYPGKWTFWMPITINGTAIVQEPLSGVPPVTKYTTKTVKINNKWIIEDIWYLAWGNSSPAPSTLYFDGTDVYMCFGKTDVWGDPSSCYDVTRTTNYFSIDLSVANTNGTWSGQYNSNTKKQTASGQYPVEINFTDSFNKSFSGYGVISEKFNADLNLLTGKDTISIKVTGEGSYEGEPMTFSITVKGSGELIFL